MAAALAVHQHVQVAVGYQLSEDALQIWAVFAERLVFEHALVQAEVERPQVEGQLSRASRVGRLTGTSAHIHGHETPRARWWESARTILYMCAYMDEFASLY